MAVQALIQFTQGPNFEPAGQAVAGTLVDGACTVSNGNNTGVVTWKYEMLYVPPGSALPLTVQGPSATPTFMFTPDVAGTYRLRLTVAGLVAVDSNVDMRCFCVPFPNGIIAPPYQRNPPALPLTGAGGKPDEMNIAGQPFGWDGIGAPAAKLLFQALETLDNLSGGGGGPFLPLDGSAAMTGDLDHGGNDIINAAHAAFGTYAPELSPPAIGVRGRGRILHTATNDFDAALQIALSTGGFDSGTAAKVAISLGTGHSASSVFSTFESKINDSLGTPAKLSHFTALSEATLESTAVSVGPLVDLVKAVSGTPGNFDLVQSVIGATDYTAALSFDGSGNITICGTVGDGLAVGYSSKYAAIFLVLGSAASHNCDLTFEFSTGIGMWTAFTPADFTSGLQRSSIIVWNPDELLTWVVGTSGLYWVRFVRNAATVLNLPIANRAQFIPYYYEWDKDGDITARAIELPVRSVNPGLIPARTMWNNAGRFMQGAETLAYVSDVSSSVASVTNRVQTLEVTGLLSGGIMTINANPALFDVAAGTGQIVDHSTNPPTKTTVSWSATTGITVTNIATSQLTNIFINNVGAVVQQTAAPTSDQRRTNIFLGRLLHQNNTTINNIISQYQMTYGLGMDMMTFFDLFGPIKATGNNWTANGANLNVNKSAGTSWLFGANYTTSRVQASITTDPAATAATFSYVYRNPGDPQGFSVLPATTVIDPNQWDDGSGTLQALTGNQYSVQRIFLIPDGITPTYRIAFGQAVYANKADAIAGISTENWSFPVTINVAVLCTFLVVKRNTAALNVLADAEFRQAGRFGTQFTGSGSGGGGETNTASNVGAGIGLFYAKNGTDLQFRSLVTQGGIATSIPIAPNDNTVLLNTDALAPRDGSRAMLAALNMGGFGLSNLGYSITTFATIAAQQNNYAPASWSTTDIGRQAATGAQTITGFSATATAIRKMFFNIGTSIITLAHESASSTAANRIFCPGSVNLEMQPNSAVALFYDVVDSRWRAAPATGATTFDQLQDTANSKAGSFGKVVCVNAGETSLEYRGIPSSFVTYVTTNGYAAPIASGQTITAPRWLPTTCRLRALVAPTVSTLTANVKVNGSSIGTFTLTVGQLTSSAAFSVLTVRVIGDVVTVDLTGTDVGWSGLTIEANGTVLLD
jgi:hypothetical protein